MSALAAAHDPAPLPSGFAELYAAHYDFVWRCALRLGASLADVEDIVQETFMVALRRYDPVEFRHGGARPSTWLFAILRNVLRNHARGERRRRARIEALADVDPGPAASDAQSALGLRLLDEFLAELEPDRRAVFVLAELEGMRGPEIARALELNPNTVRSRLRAARQAFHARFEHEHEPIVEAAANEAAPREARARGLMLLGFAPMTSVKVSPAAKLGALASARGMAIGSAMLIGLGLVIVIAKFELDQPKPRDPIHTDAATIAKPDPSEPATAVSEPEPPIVIEAEQPRPPGPRPTRRTKPRSPAKLDGSAALERLEDARKALLDGDAKACLALLEDQRGWPTTLDARRVALEVGALCSLGRSEAARARAQAWVAAHPDASTAVDLRGACWTDDNTPATRGHQATNGPSAREEQR